jgi:predicted PurR-regulated permease PerM
MTFYLLADGARIQEYLLTFVPPGRRASVHVITDRMGERMGHWLLGQVFLCLLIGGVCYGALLLLGVPGALMLGVIAGVLEIIPNLGPVLAAIPACLVALTQSPLLALVTALTYWVIQMLENAVIVPKLMGRAVALHPLVVMVALSVGAALFGVVGALIAVPVTAALAVLLGEIQRVIGTSRQDHEAETPEGASPPSVDLGEPKAGDGGQP